MTGIIGRGSRLGRVGAGAIGGAGALLLLCAGAATASHIDGGAYYGDLPGGGTIEVLISNDGSEADAVTGRNMPATPPPCGNFIEATANDVPISSHAYSVANNPGVTSSGSFASYGEVSGTYLAQASGCSSGTQAFTAAIPVDVALGRSNDPSPLGDGVYSRTGANQTREWTAKQGRTRTFVAGVANDGPYEETAEVDGCASTKGFKVTYRDPGGDITDEVVAGTYQKDLLPGAGLGVNIDIKAKQSAKVGKTKSCKLGGEIDGTRDVARAQLKVKEG
jgi:hypothetical protein